MNTATRNGHKAKVGQVPLSGTVPIEDIKPSPENDKLYRPIDPDDPDILALAVSICEQGILEPLVLTLDCYIISGHRRYAAAKLARLKSVPVRFVKLRRSDDPDKFLILLREHNRQREKTRDEKLREEILSINPDEAYRELVAHRRKKSEVDIDGIILGDTKRRKKISDAKWPFLEAILDVIKARREYWPLSVRQVHYALLNDPPLKHATKPDSRYDNTQTSYKSLDELLVRARLEGLVPMDAISDDTRPVTIWQTHQTTRHFIASELDRFLKKYARDLMQSQPCHIEVVCEKNTVAGILETVVSEYCIPLTSGRGYCSLPPRQEMYDRFSRSGKQALVVLLVTDFDPDGEQIAQSFARSMRDDFGIFEDAIVASKVALTKEQVEEYELPPIMQAKQTSVNYEKFSDKYGDDVHELEALEPSDLQKILRETIDGVIDMDAFNSEVDAEHEDAAFLKGVRRTVAEALKGVDFGGETSA